MKQNIFIYTERGSDDPNIDLFKRECFYRNFEPIAILTPEDKIPTSILQKIPIVLLESTDFDRFLKLGAPRKNLISWRKRGRLKRFVEKDSDGVTRIYCNGLEFICNTQSQIEEAEDSLERLDHFRVNSLTPPEQYKSRLADILYAKTGIEMDWKNPRTIQEKICWLKFYDMMPLKIICSDKILARDYIAEKIGEEYLIPLLDVWENPADIDFDRLPNRFVLKTNHGSHMNIIVPDKSRLDFRFAREKLKAWLMGDYGFATFGLYYSRIPRKILAEKFIEVAGESDPPDYKFYCFNGEPICCQFMTGRTADLHHTFFDLDWKPVEYRTTDYPRHENPEKIPRPRNFDLMIEFARKLSKDFALVRVDFYNVDGRIFAGELTFAPASGISNFNPLEWNEKLGDMIKLPTE